MRLVVVGSPESWYLEDLRRAAAQRHSIIPVAWRDLTATLGGGSTEIRAAQLSMTAADAVLVRTMPTASLEQVVFRMDLLARLAVAGIPVVNPPRAMEAAIDKYLALARLQAAGLCVPRTVVCQTVDEAAAAFEKLGGDIVLKPLFGSEGRGLVRINDLGMAERACSLFAAQGAVLYLQEFIRHPGYDVRVLRIGQRLLAIRRHNARDWRTNLSRGGAAEPLEIDDQMTQLALAAAEAIGAPLAGIDLLPGPDGQLYVIEVNAVPGWRGLARSLDVDVASLVLAHLESLVRRDRQI